MQKIVEMKELNYELIASLPPGKRWAYMLRRDRMLKYELIFIAFGVVYAVWKHWP